MTDAVDQILADMDRLHRQHEAELSNLVERHACERDALVASLRTLTSAPASPAPDLEPSPSKPRRFYRPTGTEKWMHVVHAAFEIRVSRTTAWRWAGEQWAQWPHGDAQHVDINRLRHLRPPGGKNGK